MQFSQARSIAARASAEACVAGRMVRCIVAVSAGLIVGLALMISARRFSGQVSRPLDGPTLAVTALTLAGLAGAGRAAWIRTLRSPRGAVGRRFVLAAPLAGVLLPAIALSIPGSSMPGLALFWAILVAEESVAIVLLTRVSPWRRFRFLGPDRSKPVDTDISHPPDVLPAMEADVTQQLTRVSLADGTDELRGRLRGLLASGQRTATLHVAFCPPFAGDPEFQIEQVSGPPVSIKSTAIMPQGARVDMRLARAEKDQRQVLLHIVARGRRVSLVSI